MRKRILLFEDSETNRQLFHDLLEIKGYQVYSLPNGLNFFQAIAEFKPALILLDLKMPYVDGYTLLQLLQDSPLCTIPVVVVSACSLGHEKQKALQLGARSYLTKPVAIEDVIQAIEADYHAADYHAADNLSSDNHCTNRVSA